SSLVRRACSCLIFAWQTNCLLFIPDRGCYIRGCPCVSVSTHRTSVAVHQYTYQHVGPWTQHAGPSRGLFGTSVGVRQHTQDVRGCPSVHISALWSLDSARWPFPWTSGDFGPCGLSVQYTPDVRVCPSAHTRRPCVSVSTHKTSVCVRQHTQDVSGCPSAHTERLWLSISTHISTLTVRGLPISTYISTLTTHISMLVLPMDCSCTDFGQLMHHVSTQISTLALSVNCSCTDLVISSSFDGLDCPRKEATGASGAVGRDGAEQTGVLPAGTIPTTVLPALVEQVDNATGLPVGPTLPTEVNDTNVDEQQEQVHGDDTGSSNVGAGSGQNVDSNNVRVTGAEEVIEPTIRGLVEAMQVMGAQIASLTQAFTPLVNSSVGQANPPVRVAAGVTDVKGISQLRLNQDTMETRVKELGAGGLAHSAGNSWRSAQSGERCVLVRISVGESGTVTGRADGPGAGQFDQMGLRLGTGSGQAPRVKKRGETAKGRLWDGYGTVLGRRDGILRIDLRQKDKEKEKEKEKEVAPGDRTPKVRGKDSLILRPWPDQIPMKDQKWTVVREKHHEDRGHGKMCGDWVDSENGLIIVAYCATCELMRFYCVIYLL
ncbi:hypothetical protein IGI04_019235, partial [Brassica rapa subsp. trilocularis]